MKKIKKDIDLHEIICANLELEETPEIFEAIQKAIEIYFSKQNVYYE